MTATPDTTKGFVDLVEATDPGAGNAWYWYRRVDARTPPTVEYVGKQTAAVPVTDMVVGLGVSTTWEVQAHPAAGFDPTIKPTHVPGSREYTATAEYRPTADNPNNAQWSNITTIPQGFVAKCIVLSMETEEWESTSQAYPILGSRERVVNVGWGARPPRATVRILPYSPQDRQRLLYTLADAGVLIVKCPNPDAIDQFPAVAESWTDEPYYDIKYGKLRAIRIQLLSIRLDHRSPAPSNAPYHPEMAGLFP